MSLEQLSGYIRGPEDGEAFWVVGGLYTYRASRRWQRSATCWSRSRVAAFPVRLRAARSTKSRTASG
jgi:hypothetical protein